MSKIIVSDTSCLILLEKLNLLYILKELFEVITITPEIEKEYGQQLPDWIKVVAVQNTVLPILLQSTLDLGEASAIALAIEQQNCLLILDDNKARKTATRLGINYVGTLGLLVEAKEAGLIPLVKPVLEQIKMTNFRVAENLEKQLLKLAGE